MQQQEAIEDVHKMIHEAMTAAGHTPPTKIDLIMWEVAGSGPRIDGVVLTWETVGKYGTATSSRAYHAYGDRDQFMACALFERAVAMRMGEADPWFAENIDKMVVDYLSS